MRPELVPLAVWVRYLTGHRELLSSDVDQTKSRVFQPVPSCPPGGCQGVSHVLVGGSGEWTGFIVFVICPIKVLGNVCPVSNPRSRRPSNSLLPLNHHSYLPGASALGLPAHKAAEAGLAFGTLSVAGCLLAGDLLEDELGWRVMVLLPPQRRAPTSPPRPVRRPCAAYNGDPGARPAP